MDNLILDFLHRHNGFSRSAYYEKEGIPIKSIFVSFVPLLIFIIGYVAAFPSLQESRKDIKVEQFKGMTLPPVVVKLVSLEFRSIVADFMFVRASQFYGGKVGNSEKATKDDWDWLYRNLDVITELDPYFQDPYYMGNGLLTWDAGMFNEANILLEKATISRTWDWWFPFLSGFNKFFFMGDNKGGADDLLIASKRPGSWGILPKLASRLYYSEGKTETARSEEHTSELQSH